MRLPSFSPSFSLFIGHYAHLQTPGLPLACHSPVPDKHVFDGKLAWKTSDHDTAIVTWHAARTPLDPLFVAHCAEHCSRRIVARRGLFPLQLGSANFESPKFGAEGVLCTCHVSW